METMPPNSFQMDPEQGHKLCSCETERQSTRDRLRGGPGEGSIFSTLTRYLLSVELQLWVWLSRSALETGGCAQDLTCTSTPHPARESRVPFQKENGRDPKSMFLLEKTRRKHWSRGREGPAAGLRRPEPGLLFDFVFAHLRSEDPSGAPAVSASSNKQPSQG